MKSKYYIFAAVLLVIGFILGFTYGESQGRKHYHLNRVLADAHMKSNSLEHAVGVAKEVLMEEYEHDITKAILDYGQVLSGDVHLLDIPYFNMDANRKFAEYVIDYELRNRISSGKSIEEILSPVNLDIEHIELKTQLEKDNMYFITSVKHHLENTEYSYNTYMTGLVKDQ